MIESILAFSAATLVSRFLGLLRDATLASIFGTSPELDSYMVAVLFPFFLRKIFAEGAVNSALVPLYKTRQDSEELISRAVGFLGITSLTVSVVITIFPVIVPNAMALGYSGQIVSRISLVSRITAPFVVFITLWAVYYSVLNSHGEYFLPAFTPALVNVGVILGALLGRSAPWCALGFTIGSGLSTLVLFIRSRRYVRHGVSFKIDPEFLKLFLKGAGAVVVSQFNMLVDTNVASFLGVGSVSTLQFATRLYQLPMGLFGVAASTVALSELSGSENVGKKLRESIDRSMFLVIPSALGLITLSRSLVDLVYGWGNFSEASVIRVSSVLIFYSIGLPAYSLLYILVRYRHAERDMDTPLKATWITAGVNSLLDPILAGFVGISGVALATSISGYLGLIYMVRKTGVGISSREMFKVIVASLTMAVVLSFLPHGKVWALVGVVIGSAVYSLMCAVLKCEGFSDLLSLIRRSR